MALARQARHARQGQVTRAPSRRPPSRSPTGSSPWSSRSPRRCSPSIAPPAGRSCWPRPRRTTWSSRSPICSASTTWSPPGTASTPTARTTARSTDRSCGAPASSPRCGSGPKANGIDLAESYAYSDSVYDTPLLAAVGHPVRRQPRPADDRDGRRRAAGRRCTSTCRQGVQKIPVRRTSSCSKLAMAFTRPVFFPYARFDIDGDENTCRTTVRRSSSATTAATSTRRRWR